MYWAGAPVWRCRNSRMMRLSSAAAATGVRSPLPRRSPTRWASRAKRRRTSAAFTRATTPGFAPGSDVAVLAKRVTYQPITSSVSTAATHGNADDGALGPTTKRTRSSGTGQHPGHPDQARADAAAPLDQRVRHGAGGHGLVQ